MTKSDIKKAVRYYCDKLELDGTITKKDHPFFNDISTLDMTGVVLIVDSMIKIRSFSNRIPVLTTKVVEPSGDIENIDMFEHQFMTDTDTIELLDEEELKKLFFRNATFKDLVMHVFREEIYAFIKGCKICISTIDDSKHVPRSKEPEHIRRSQNIKDTPYEDLPDKDDPTKKVWDGVSPILTYAEQEVPEWKSICASRKARRQVIKDIITYVKNGNLKFSSGRKMYIDYGGDVGYEGQPICIERDGRRMFWTYEPSMFNQVGEGEKMIIFYADYFARRGYNILSSSRDTDSMMLWLHYLSDIMSSDYDNVDDSETETIQMIRSRIFIHRFGTVKNTFKQALGKRSHKGEIVTVHPGKNEAEISKIQDYCCMNKLYSVIKDHVASKNLKGQAIKYPILTFCTMMTMAGSDFVEGLKGITHETFFKAFINHLDYIGDIFEIKKGYLGIHDCFKTNGDILKVMDINTGALYRCICAAVFTVQRYRSKLLHPVKTEKDADPSTYSKILHKTTYDKITKAVAISNPKNVSNHLKSNYINYFGRVWWNIIYDMIAYKYKPPDCTVGFGWKENEEKHIVVVEDF